MKFRIDTSRHYRRIIAGAVFGPLVLTACNSDAGSPTNSASADRAVPAVSAGTGPAETGPVDTGPAETGHGETGVTEPPTSSSNPAGEAPYTVDLPAGVSDGSPEAAAWEALMGVDGEYAAYALYGAVIDEHGQVEPYVTIQEQEQRHADALSRQLARMGVEVPENPYLGRVDAPADLHTAAENWAKGEVLNIAMYDQLLADAESDPQLVRVFGHLRRASEEAHLPMFQAAAENDGTLGADEMEEFRQQHAQMENSMHGDGEGGHEHGSGNRRGQGAQRSGQTAPEDTDTAS